MYEHNYSAGCAASAPPRAVLQQYCTVLECIERVRGLGVWGAEAPWPVVTRNPSLSLSSLSLYSSPPYEDPHHERRPTNFLNSLSQLDAMVLQELGGSISRALQKLNTATTIDDEVLKQILKDICQALMEADVNIKAVAKLKKAVEKKLAAQVESSSAANKRKLLQTAVYNELVAMMDPGAKPWVPERKKSQSRLLSLSPWPHDSPPSPPHSPLPSCPASFHSPTWFR